jgi:hypothetical protein
LSLDLLRLWNHAAGSEEPTSDNGGDMFLANFQGKILLAIFSTNLVLKSARNLGPGIGQQALSAPGACRSPFQFTVKSFF